MAGRAYKSPRHSIVRASCFCFWPLPASPYELMPRTFFFLSSFPRGAQLHRPSRLPFARSSFLRVTGSWSVSYRRRRGNHLSPPATLEMTGFVSAHLACLHLGRSAGSPSLWRWSGAVSERARTAPPSLGVSRSEWRLNAHLRVAEPWLRPARRPGSRAHLPSKRAPTFRRAADVLYTQAALFERVLYTRLLCMYFAAE